MKGVRVAVQGLGSVGGGLARKLAADGAVLTITYDKLLELYFQNPEFGYYFLRLTTERLMQNINRLEGSLTDIRSQIAIAAVAPGKMAAAAT